jgi:hypothetical protein
MYCMPMMDAAEDMKAKAVPLHATEALGGGEEVKLLLIHDLGVRSG